MIRRFLNIQDPLGYVSLDNVKTAGLATDKTTVFISYFYGDPITLLHTIEEKATDVLKKILTILTREN